MPEAPKKHIDYLAGSSDYPIPGSPPTIAEHKVKYPYGKTRVSKETKFSGVTKPATDRFVPTQEIPDNDLSPEDLVIAKERFIALKSDPANEKVTDEELWEQAVAAINADEESN